MDAGRRSEELWQEILFGASLPLVHFFWLFPYEGTVAWDNL